MFTAVGGGSGGAMCAPYCASCRVTQCKKTDKNFIYSGEIQVSS